MPSTHRLPQVGLTASVPPRTKHPIMNAELGCISMISIAWTVHIVGWTKKRVRLGLECATLCEEVVLKLVASPGTYYPRGPELRVTAP
eukprot:scaffold55282_cov60-Phaeocystis_antarctica.AAC.2